LFGGGDWAPNARGGGGSGGSGDCADELHVLPPVRQAGGYPIVSGVVGAVTAASEPNLVAHLGFLLLYAAATADHADDRLLAPTPPSPA